MSNSNDVSLLKQPLYNPHNHLSMHRISLHRHHRSDRSLPVDLQTRTALPGAPVKCESASVRHRITPVHHRS